LGLSLGNLGFSESKCLIETMTKASLTSEEGGIQLQCPSGKISGVSDFGITTPFEDQLSCTRNSTTQYCYQFLHTQNLRGYINT